MKLSIESDLFYQVYGPTTFFFSIACSRVEGQRIFSESILPSPSFPIEEMEVGSAGNRFLKWHLNETGDVSLAYRAHVESACRTIGISEIPFQSIEAVDAAGIPYLFPSRYVPSDRMRTAAFDLFGNIEGPFDVAMAIEEWLFQNISYQMGASTEQSSAADTFLDRVGVCRDFAHLGIAFCRALNLPARYLTVYAYQLQPQDFHAVFEVYIDGQWYLVDGTRIAPLNGMVRIASGRDAGDVAAAMLLGNVSGSGIQVQVHCEGGEDEFVPLTRADLMSNGQAVQISASGE